MATKIVGPNVPRQGNALTRWIGRFVLRLMGFEVKGDIPNLSKFVIVAAPHTSNWDWVLAMAFLWSTNFKVFWLGKHSLFRGPLGPIMRWFGGVPVDRRAPHGTVGEAIRIYQSRDCFVLGVTPEGTRSHVREWKTGFHRIAQGAGVPLFLVGFDYGRKTVQIGPVIQVTDDVEGDIARLQAHFEQMKGKYPKRRS